MYIISPSRAGMSFGLADIDGKNKVKVAEGEQVGTGAWSHHSGEF